MKKSLHLFVIVFTLCFSHLSKAQTYNGDLTLTRQEEVDAFNYTKVNGSLYISNTSTGTPITNLNGLSELTEVASIGNRLGISCNTLKSLDGLSNLVKINGNLDIAGDSLSDLSGLSSVTLVNGHINIFADALVELNAFNLLESNSAINIVRCDNLQAISGFENMTSTDYMFVENCPNLERISGFQSLERATGSITIENNPKLVDISGFQKLTSVGSDFKIRNNTLLTDFCGIYNLVHNGGATEITGNAQNPTPEEIIASCGTSSVPSITEQEIAIYPNSANDKITINCPQFIEAEVFTASGSLLLSSVVPEINIQALKPGVYVAKVKSEQGTYTSKFIKQ